jgi:tetratricopeptide (TPR) repeat protein
LLLTGVFALKLIVVLQLKDHALLQADAGLDTTAYVDLARQAIGGNLLLEPGLYFVSPLYIYFAAAVLAIADSLTALRVVQVALGTVAVSFVFIAAREWFGTRAAWVAATLAALTGLFTFYETLILQAALDPVLTAAALALLALALNRRWRGWFVLAGVVLGLQALNRPNVVLPVAAIVLALMGLRRWRHAALLAAGVLAAFAPATLRNAVVADEWTPLASHGGLNFYIGNNESADGTYRLVPGITPSIAGQRADARHVAEAALGRQLDDGEVSAYFYASAWSWIRSHPADALRLFLEKVRYTVGARHVWLNYSYPFFAYDERTLLAALVVGPWLLMPLGMAGLMLAAPSDRRAEYLVWVAFVPSYALSVALFFASERYRLPLLIPMCIGSGAILDRLYGIVRTPDRRRLAQVAMVVAALAAIVNWPLGLDDGRSEQRVRMTERLIAIQRDEEAARWSALALDGHPIPGVARFRIGRAWLARGRADAALPHLQDAARLDPDRPETSFALGQALLDSHRPAEAIPHLQRAFDAGVRRDLAGVDLVRAHAALGNREAALRVLQAVAPQRESDSASWHALGKLAEDLGAPALAADFYGRAVAVDPASADTRRQHGLMLAVLGRTADAAAAFEALVALAPDDASAHLNLAVVYAQLGRLDEARRHAREALRLQPGYDKAMELLRIIR